MTLREEALGNYIKELERRIAELEGVIRNAIDLLESGHTWSSVSGVLRQYLSLCKMKENE